MGNERKWLGEIGGETGGENGEGRVDRKARKET
jgi:hypothetical protein